MTALRACALSDVPDGGSVRVELPAGGHGPEAVAIVLFEGEVYAIEDRCSHADVPLTDGDVDEIDGAPVIECALHGSCFDLRTGQPTHLPATAPVPVYPVRVEGGDVFVDTDVHASAAVDSNRGARP